MQLVLDELGCSSDAFWPSARLGGSDNILVRCCWAEIPGSGSRDRLGPRLGRVCPLHVGPVAVFGRRILNRARPWHSFGLGGEGSKGRLGMDAAGRPGEGTLAGLGHVAKTGRMPGIGWTDGNLKTQGSRLREWGQPAGRPGNSTSPGVFGLREERAP